MQKEHFWLICKVDVRVPLGCYSRIENAQLVLNGFVASTDGKQYLQDTVSGDPDFGFELGIELAEKLKEQGAVEILAQIKSTNQATS